MPKAKIQKITAAAVSFFLVMSAESALAGDKVLVSIPPLHSLAAGLMAGTGEEPALLLEDAASPHSYSLKPSDMIKIEQAELVVMVDEYLEGFLHKPLRDKQDKVLVLSQAKGIKTYPLRSIHHHHNEDVDEHSHEHNEHYEESDIDEHIWLDTDNAKAVLNALQDSLVKLYPENQEKYQENKIALFAELDELKAKQQAELATVKNEPFLVYHDGWQYYEKQNGLNGVGSVVIDEDILQSVKSRIALADKVQQLKVKCLFTEPQFDSAAVKSVAEDLGLKTAEIDALGFGMPKDKNLYFALMRKNTENIRDCLKQNY